MVMKKNSDMDDSESSFEEDKKYKKISQIKKTSKQKSKNKTPIGKSSTPESISNQNSKLFNQMLTQMDRHIQERLTSLPNFISV